MLNIIAEKKDWLMCHECGQLQSVVAISPEFKIECSNCGKLLHAGGGRWLESAVALAVTALVLFALSLFSPFLTLEIGSQTRTITVVDGFWALLDRDYWILGAVFIVTVFIFPLFEIIAYLYLLLPYTLNRRLPGQSLILRWLVLVQAWSMLEVLLLSMVVASVKMADMALLHLEVGAYALFVLVAVLILAFIKLDRQSLWSWINTNNYFVQQKDDPVIDCGICHAMVGESIVVNSRSCPRCNSEISWRIPNSLQKTMAFVLAAAILYVPANVLPIMTYSTLGTVESSTIFSGVIELIAADLYWIAVIVFTASIALPIFKLIVLSYLVWSVHAGWTMNIKHRVVLYRITEVVGRWSMVDVFVVTIFVALVQFGFVYTVEPEGAIVAFGSVVVLTMIAAETFDPRLLWDAKEIRENAAVLN